MAFERGDTWLLYEVYQPDQPQEVAEIWLVELFKSIVPRSTTGPGRTNFSQLSESL